MKKSEIWLEEEEHRKDEISEWFGEATELLYSDDFEDYKSKIIDIINKARKGKSLTTQEKDLLNYVSGEIDRDSLIIDTYNLIKKEQVKNQEEFKRNIIKERKFKKVKNKNYSVADKKIIGYTKNVESKVVVEKYLSKGKIKIRGRNTKGQFSSFVSKK